MNLNALSVINFKNYIQADLELSKKINCFVGENGVGKTNLLDAIHYLALCKSNFNPVDTQNIRYESDFAIIQGQFDRLGKKEEIYCSIRRNKKKQFKRNKKDYKRLIEHIGLIPAVMISPIDTNLILGGNEERRKFFNAAIGQYDNQYLANVISYNKVLSQRNTLLKDIKDISADHDLLDVLDQQLIQYGLSIHAARYEFHEKLNPVFQKFYQHVSGNKEMVELEYKSQLNQADFGKLLKESRQKDFFLHYTTKGVHRDDMTMLLAKHPLKKVGSQGQQKTYLTALKLAEFEFMKDTMNNTPILLLDDIFDKFDSFRVRQIIKLVAENTFGQIFITDTNEIRMMEILKEIPVDNKVFLIGKDGISLKEQ